MNDVLRSMLANQFEAALCTLNACVDRCPDEAWHAPVKNVLFCQVAFHTLFFTDAYLETSKETMMTQPFHRQHPELFRDYEETEDRPRRLRYERRAVKEYLAFCREKASRVVASETVEMLSAPCGFPPKKFSRLELHVYNLRHIQHHSAQLSLRLRIDFGVDIDWAGSGWREL
jgi:hypothetical protein